MTNNSMSFAGTDLGTATYGLTVLTSPHPTFSGFDTPEFTAAGADGSVAGTSSYKPKSFSVRALVDGTSRSNAQARLDATMGILNVRNADSQLIFDHTSGRYILCRLGSASVAGDPKGSSAWLLDLEFIAHDPFAYSTSETVDVLTIASDPDTENTSSVGGSVRGLGSWVLNPTGSVTAWSIQNDSATGTPSISWAGASTSDQFRVTPGEFKLERSDDGGSTWTNAISGMSGSWPWLEPGSVNAITTTGFSAGTLTITYRDRYT